MHTKIIAEAGVNHNGNIEIAKKLIEVAASSGADYVKFQTFKTSKLVTNLAKQADYQKACLSGNDDLQFKLLKKLELNEEMHLELKQYCTKCGISFLSTGFDEESIDYLDSLDIPFFKIPSGEITNKPYLIHVAKKGKPVVMSTGMSTIDDIRAALSVLNDNGLPLSLITVLHCNTEYPTPMEDVNLLAMLHIRDTFGVRVGYSDHTKGIEVAISAVALGAEFIEKHFTLDRSMEGPDHKASLEPQELKAMVQAIRNIERAISGSGEKVITNSERPNVSIARKSIHMGVPILSGEVLQREHLVMKRPGDGISPMLIDQIIGKKVNKDLQVDYKLSWEDLNI